MPLSSTKTNCCGSRWATAARQAVRASSSRSLAASVFFYASSPGGGSPATSSPRSVLPLVLRPPGAVLQHGRIWCRFQPRPQQGLLLPPNRRGPPGIGVRAATPSRAAAPRSASPWTLSRQSAGRLLAWADPRPPPGPNALVGRSNRLACPPTPHYPCLPLLPASCSRILLSA